MASENGWEPSPRIAPNDPLLVWRKVPGSDVTIQVRNDHAGTAMLAYAADYHAFVEPLVDRMTACYTPTNSVSTSNHLNATAMDFDWDYYPWKKRGNLNGDKLARLRDLLAYWRGIMFWAGDWDDAYVDEMHHQMDYGSYDLERNGQLGQWIKDHIRADGFSTYKRGGTPAPPVVVAPPVPASNQVDVLVRATGVSMAKAQEILVGVVNGLRDSQCTNVNRIAMWLAQIGHESAGFNATEEYEDGDESTDRWKYKGRTWIQITWQSNYAGLSKWAFGKGLIPTPTYFVDNPKKLAEIQYAGLGPAWYWTVARPQINSLCDQRDLYAVTQAINGGQNGAPDRKNRYDRALTLGDQLLALTTTTSGDDMAAVPQEQWDRVYRELTQQLPSRSPLRHLGEGLVDTVAGFVLNTDGSEHVEICRLLAGYGHPPTIALLREVAGADPNLYPDRQDDAELAQAILAEATNTVVAPSKSPQVAAVAPAPQVVYVDRPAAPAAPAEPPPVVVNYSAAPSVASSTGQVIGQAYDALEALQLSGVLNDTEKAPLLALIGVLQTKSGVSA